MAGTDKECQMWRFQYLCARLDGDKGLTSLGYLQLPHRKNTEQ